MDEDTAGTERGGRPPLNLTRAGYGYLVIAAGVAVTFVLLWNVPGRVQSSRLVRLSLAFVIAIATGSLYQYVTGTWYDQFE